MDLDPCPGAPPGDGSRRAWPKTAPIPPEVAPGARREQVRPDCRFRDGSSPDPQSRGARPSAEGASQGKGRGHDRPPARDDLHPHRKRGVREAEQLLRPDHAPRPPRRRQGIDRAVSLQRQKRRRGRPGCHRPPNRARDQELRGAARSETLPVHRRRGGAADGDVRRCERVSATGEWRRLHGEGLPHLGRHGARARGAA